MKRYLTLMVLTMLLLTSGCGTSPEPSPLEFESAPLMGMIYDADNQPVAGVQLYVDGEAGPQSDVNGRFVIPSVERGKHELRALRQSYEPTTVEFEFLSRSQVLYLRMVSIDHLERLAEEAIERRRYEEAREYIRRARALDSMNPVVAFLDAILFYREEEHAQALNLLNALLEEGRNETYIHLLLADVYQYGLSEFELALFHLRIAYRRSRDEALKRRIDELSEDVQGETHETE